MKHHKLVWQIYPATLIAVIAAIVAVTWYGSVVFQNFYLHEAEIDLEARANLIKSRVYDYLQADNQSELREFSKRAGRESGTRITIVDKTGRVLSDSNENPEIMDNHRERPEILTAFTGKRGRAVRFSHTLGQSMLYIALPLYEGNSPQGYNSETDNITSVIRMSVPITSLYKTLQGLLFRVIAGCIIISLGGALITLLISRNISRPLEEMTKTAEQFARGEFTQRMTPRLNHSSSHEVTALAVSMDRMAEMLDEKIKAIETQRNELETVFSSMVESVIAIDLDERIISINTAAARLLGITQEKAQGKLVQEVIRHTHLQDQIQQILNTRRSVEDEIVLQDAGGDRYLQTSVVTLSDGTGSAVGVLIVMNDVTHIRRLEHIRRDFVANVSHELRTPITSIRGYVETLLDGALDSREDSEKFLHIVLRQSKRLTAIIDDLLALSRIEQESSDGSVYMEEGPLCCVLETAVQTCQVNADNRGVKMEFNCAGSIVARMNDTLIEQAVVNLLVNAIKYSDSGDTITVRADVENESDESVVKIRVIDMGCGISPEHLPRLFERFYRSDKARSRELGGTGLGLAIVKHIVQAHGGRVDVKSELGKGSEFTLTIAGRKT
ncbi:ATP-binding protein [Desulfosediminicola flagellatus]|uniref:ATP-binding protein n=1 Tax=Desulfosediminicola flagellatus TaxID=2569541 RepID=UPI0010AD34F7|nr:ATP-binding protein [Desulfosediminicola flagellatus]